MAVTLKMAETIDQWRRARWFRPLLGLFALMVVALISALLIPRLVDLESSRGAITSQIEKQLGRRVALGALSFRLLPTIEVRAAEVRIADDPAFASGDFVTARGVRLEVGLWSLLRGSPQLRGIELDSPAIILIRRPGDGASDWNWRTLRPLREPGGGAEQGALDLVVRDGRFNLIDRMAEPPVETRYEGIDIRLDGFTPRKSFAFNAGVKLPAEEGQPGGRIALDGRMGPIPAENPAATPIEAQVTLDAVAIAALEALAGNPRSGRSGRLTLDAQLGGQLSDQLKMRGSLRAEALRLTTEQGVGPTRVPLDLRFDLAASAPASASRIDLRITEGELALGATRLRATGQIGLSTKPDGAPTLDLTFEGQGVVLESLLESANSLGFGPPAGTKAAGVADLRLNLRRSGADPLQAAPSGPALNGEVVVRGLRFESSALPQAIAVSELKLTATPQEIGLAPFQTSLGARSTLTISRLAVSDYQTSPLLRLEARTDEARLEDLLRVAESFGLRPDLRGSGLVTLSVNVEAVTGPSPKLTRLSGSGRVSALTLETSTLTRPVTVSSADLTFTGDSARLDKLAVAIGSSDVSGVVRIGNFNRPEIGFDLRANQLSVPEISSLIRESPGQPASGTATEFTAAGQLAIGRLVLDGLTAGNVQARISFRDRILTLDPLSLALCGGDWRGAVRLDQRTAAIALKGRLTGVEINQLLSGVGKPSPLFGRLDGQVDLRGRNPGGDAGTLLNSLTGNGQISISDGKITSFDLMKQVETIGRFVNLPTGGAATAFRQLRTNLRFEPGVMRTDALQIAMTDLSATGEGAVRFGDPGQVDYAILARLSPTLTKRILAGRPGRPADPAALSPDPSAQPSRAGGLGQFVGTFFTERDSLVIPLRISGPLTSPKFGLDADTLRKRATGSLIDNLRQRILGSPNEPPNPPTDETKRPNPTEAIRGILDRFKKKKPGEQP